MRILFIAGYLNDTHHRKVEFLADAPDVELLHVLHPAGGRASGRYPSADGRRTYSVEVVARPSLGQPDDPHRHFHWPWPAAVRAFRPDLIHCEYEQESLMTADVALLRRWLAPRAPLVLYAWQNLLRPRRVWLRTLSAWTLRQAQALVCGNTAAVQVARAQGFAGRAEVRPMIGVDVRVFHPRAVPEVRARLGLAGPVVGYVGRLVPEKGVDVLLRAVARMTEPAQILIVGGGPQEAELRALANALGLAGRCVFTGESAPRCVSDYMNALDVLALPSRAARHWQEQFGRVLAEAMACRVAVVGADTGAIPEVLGFSKGSATEAAGRVFPEGDAEALARQLDELLRRPDKRAELAGRGYARAQTLYTAEGLAAGTLALWRDLLAG